jgi:hypothetical protein
MMSHLKHVININVKIIQNFLHCVKNQYRMFVLKFIQPVLEYKYFNIMPHVVELLLTLFVL